MPCHATFIFCSAAPFTDVSSDYIDIGDETYFCDYSRVTVWYEEHEKATRLPPIDEVRTILDHSIRGMLSTFSQELLANPKCSLLIAKKSPCTDKEWLNCVGRVVCKRPEYPKT
ncbi:hypothetical protein L2E82_43838 [Cichorium intybus]|uniref:Uncharacterized protein n=1 Tax=Cichorium intybus TaxID=13427 RepID=A0ACB8ZP43_CICIN|nr:hypothetical protein L2E82_43838 [Cichorium intybus]